MDAIVMPVMGSDTTFATMPAVLAATQAGTTGSSHSAVMLPGAWSCTVNMLKGINTIQRQTPGRLIQKSTSAACAASCPCLRVCTHAAAAAAAAAADSAPRADGFVAFCLPPEQPGLLQEVPAPATVLLLNATTSLLVAR
jgi:hypothetical protein